MEIINNFLSLTLQLSVPIVLGALCGTIAERGGVILLGVDGARVPPSQGVNDVSKNYLIHKAYNMLYLTVSRAKNAVILLGDKQNGDSECLDHSLSVHTLERSD